MQLQPGHRLGPYEIVDCIGAGGMGEVYRARDTRLSRQVAIKVLRGALRDNPRLRARFDREAKAISSLNDPHICALHDIGSDNGVDYLVLEYCDGLTLAQRVDRGPLPVALVLQYGIEIAAALSRAHRADIIHRDLKPSNIMLTRSGVKLLDFGLAKPAMILTDGEGSRTTSLRDPVTLEGSLVGTVRYMAPEVLAGEEADARTDIFALGVVLYEMLTGKPAFSGTSTPSIMAAILSREPPPVRELQPETPAALEHVIAKSLAKNPEERWESAYDIAEQLRWISESPDAPSLRKRRRYVPFVIAGAALLVVLAAAAMLRPRHVENDRVARLSIPLAETSEAALPDRPGLTLTGFDLSRDGSRVAYAGCAPCDSHATNSHIYVRELNSFETVAVPGTEGGGLPFFSPDGQWIGFFVSGELRKIPITGGTPQIISSQSAWSAEGMWWAPDGTIYFCPSLGEGLWSVPATGGKPRRITVPDTARGENSHRWPQVLPDGEHVLFTVRTAEITSFDQARLAILTLKSGTWKVVLEGGSYGRYVNGQLLFARAGALYAVPFDLASTSVQGTPRKVLDHLQTNTHSGEGGYRVSEDGDLAYLRGEPARDRSEILAVDHQGGLTVVTTLPVEARRPNLSPDGRKLAFTVFAANAELWVYDFESALATRIVAQPGDQMNPIWTPDGTHLIYRSGKRIVRKQLDSSGDEEVLLRSAPGTPVPPWMTSCSPDGKTLLFSENDPETKSDIWILPLEGDRKPYPLVRSRSAEYAAQFSPDGRWIAYVANETGHAEVYLVSTTGTGRSQVSQGGGNAPTWSWSEKEIFYLRGDEMMAVPLSVERDRLHAGRPRVLFRSPADDFFAVTKDGFLMFRQLAVSEPREINVVLNWKRELLR